MNPIKDRDEVGESPTTESGEPIRFANATLEKYRHICAFFHGPDEGYRVLLPFTNEPELL